MLERESHSHRKRETASEERCRRVREGDNIFIDDSDEEALRTGRMPMAGPSGRSDTPIPSGGIHYILPPCPGRLSSKEWHTLAPAEHLVPIEVLDENEESVRATTLNWLSRYTETGRQDNQHKNHWLHGGTPG